MLNPEMFDNINIKFLRQEQIQKQYYDKSSSLLNESEPGDKIPVQNMITKLWEPTTVLSKTKNPRSYKI